MINIYILIFQVLIIFLKITYWEKPKISKSIVLEKYFDTQKLF